MGVVGFLRRELARRSERNSRYSLRAFARDLDCDHATLSQWLRGKRPMSFDAEEHVFARLDMDAAERARARELDDEDLRVFGAIKQASTTLSYDIASSAGLPIDRTNVALTKLLRLHAVQIEKGRWHILEEPQ